MDLVSLFQRIESGFRSGAFGVQRTTNGFATHFCILEHYPQGTIIRREPILDGGGSSMTGATRVVRRVRQ